MSNSYSKKAIGCKVRHSIDDIMVDVAKVQALCELLERGIDVKLLEDTLGTLRRIRSDIELDN